MARTKVTARKYTSLQPVPQAKNLPGRGGTKTTSPESPQSPELDEQSEAVSLYNQILPDLALSVKVLLSNNQICDVQSELNYKNQIFKIKNPKFLTFDEIISNKNIFAFQPSELIALFGTTTNWPLDVGMIVVTEDSKFVVDEVKILTNGKIKLSNEDEQKKIKINTDGTVSEQVKFYFPVSAGDARSYKVGFSTTEDERVREQLISFGLDL